MPERGFDTGFWSDTFIQKLPSEGKLLYAYLWTNSHCNQAGLYEITPETIAFETKLSEANIPALLEILKPKVVWYRDENLVWVKNFIKKQSKSPKFLAAAAKSLTAIHHNEAIKELLNYNLQRYGISIPYQYYMDMVSIPSISVSNTVSVSNSGSKGVRVVKGKGRKSENNDIPPSESEIEESLSEGDREIISVWCSVEGLALNEVAAKQLVASLRTEFPDLDILAESKAWAARKLSEPLGRGSRPSAQIWNWMRKAREFAQERRKNEQAKGQRVKGARPASDFQGRKW